jgi:flagellar hook-associated protein 3 FlgL
MSIVSTRISNFTSDRNAVAAMRRQQAEVAQTQKEVSSGKRGLTDPSQITSAEALKAFVTRADRYAENASLANYRLGLAEAGLASALDAMQTAREFVVNANTASVNPESRPILAIQVREMREHLLEIVNRKDAEGNSLFAGLKTGVVPFVKSGASIVYQGDAEARPLQLSETRSIEDGFSGAKLFVEVPEGNGTFVTVVNPANTGSVRMSPGSVTNATAWASFPLPRQYTLSITEVAGVQKYEIRAGVPPSGAVLQTGDYASGAGIEFRGASFTLTGVAHVGDSFQIKQAETEDVFETLNRLAAALDTPLNNPAVTAQITSEYDSILEQVDRVIENLNLARASVGSRLDVVETTGNFRTEQKLLAEKTLSTLRDVDFAEAVSRLNTQMQALQVAQQVYAKASTKSLFDYL